MEDKNEVRAISTEDLDKAIALTRAMKLTLDGGGIPSLEAARALVAAIESMWDNGVVVLR